MKSNKTRKERPNVTIDEYLMFCQEEISIEEYFGFEKERFEKKIIASSIWIEIITNQSLKCYYCQTDLRTIQQLIIKKIIKPRKRGPDNYSGLHFELDHKNGDNNDNRRENLVASCYYCNNDKSDTFASDLFKKYFGVTKCKAFKKLFEDNNLLKTESFRHHLKGKSKNNN